MRLASAKPVPHDARAAQILPGSCQSSVASRSSVASNSRRTASRPPHASSSRSVDRHAASRSRSGSPPSSRRPASSRSQRTSTSSARADLRRARQMCGPSHADQPRVRAGRRSHSGPRSAIRAPCSSPSLVTSSSRSADPGRGQAAVVVGPAEERERLLGPDRQRSAGGDPHHEASPASSSSRLGAGRGVPGLAARWLRSGSRPGPRVRPTSACARRLRGRRCGSGQGPRPGGG